MAPREFDYKHKWPGIAYNLGFLACLGVVCCFAALTNDHAVIVKGVKLTASEAQWLFWGGFAVSLGWLVETALRIYHRLNVPQRIVLGLDRLILPRGRWTTDEIEIPYAEIEDLSAESKSGDLEIKHSDGKHTICLSMLPSKSDFDEIATHLAKVIGTNRNLNRANVVIGRDGQLARMLLFLGWGLVIFAGVVFCGSLVIFVRFRDFSPAGFIGSAVLFGVGVVLRAMARRELMRLSRIKQQIEVRENLP